MRSNPRHFLVRSSSWFLALALVASLLSIGNAEVAMAEPGTPPSVDLTQISNTPVAGQWGVSGLDPNRANNYDNVVWDFAQIGDRIYVAGSFLYVQKNVNATPISRPYLAAFDVYTGDWDPGFNPSLDGSVYALEVSTRNTLLVGGEFTSVGGVANTAGLTSLDPVTGALDAQWVGSVERRWTNDVAVVRSLEVAGNDLYVAGQFNHVRGATDAQTTRVYKVGRFSANYGYPDGTYKPLVSGESVWGFGVDAVNNRLHLAGRFQSVNGNPGSGNFWTVDLVTGADVPGVTPLDRNTTGQMDMFDAEVAGGKIWAGGAEHIVHVLDATTQNELGWHTTGFVASDNRNWFNKTYFVGGGDYQVLEEIGDYVFGGCHCNAKERNGVASSYSSFQDQRYETLLLQAFDKNTGNLIDSFVPDLAGSEEGVWAVHADTLGCLLVGGDFEVGGVDTGSAYWVGNFARFCPPGIDFGTDTENPTVPGNFDAVAQNNTDVLLTWDAATDNRTVTGYIVTRDGVEIDTVTGLTYTDLNPGAGFHDYRVRAQDAAGNKSPNSPTISVLLGDTEAPTVPMNVVATANGADVTLDWDDSSDPSGIAGYNVYRNGSWIMWTTASQHTDAGLADGVYTYEVRAYDVPLNSSVRSAPVEVTVGNPGAGFTCSVTNNADGSATVAWDDIGANGYDLAQDALPAIWVTSASYVDFTPGTNYSVTGWGNGAGGATTSCVNPNPGGGGFTCAVVNNANGSVTVSWDSIGASGYDVAKDGGAPVWVTSISMEDFTPGANYTVTAWGNGVGGTTTSCVNPNPGGGGFSCSTTVNIDGSVTVTWDDIGANGYDVAADGGAAQWVNGTIYVDTTPGAAYSVIAWGNGTNGNSTSC